MKETQSCELVQYLKKKGEKNINWHVNISIVLIIKTRSISIQKFNQRLVTLSVEPFSVFLIESLVLTYTPLHMHILQIFQHQNFPTFVVPSIS